MSSLSNISSIYSQTNGAGWKAEDRYDRLRHGLSVFRSHFVYKSAEPGLIPVLRLRHAISFSDT